MRNINTRLAAAALAFATLGGGALFAQYPAPLNETYNDGDLTNEYGGASDSFSDLGPLTDAAVDTLGTTGGAGDFAWRSNIAVGTFAFFGHQIMVGGNNALIFTHLEFDLRVGTGTAFTDYGIRLEDTTPSAGPEFQNYTIPLSTYMTPTATYQHYSIPLADFTPGTEPQEVSLNTLSNIVFPNLSGGGTPVEVDFIIDNVQFTGTAVAPPDAPPIPLFDDFDDADLDNNYGGTASSFYGFGNPFTQDDAQITNAAIDTAGTTGGAGDHAWSATGSLTHGADFTFFGHQITLNTSGTNDISVFNTIQFDARVGTGTAHADYGVRLEDPTNTFNCFTLPLSAYGPALGTTYATYTIPVADFVAGTGAIAGSFSPDVTNASTFVWANGTLGASPSEVDFFVDNFELTNIFDAPPTPFSSTFDFAAIDPAQNNYGGTTTTFDGVGDVQESTYPDASGATGAAGDAAWRVNGPGGGPLVDSGFFGQFVSIVNPDDMANNQDISGFNYLTFDARVGTGTAYSDYGVRIEDTTGSQFNAFTLPLSNYGTLTTTYSTFSIPLADFPAGTGASGGTTPVDLTQVRVIVWPGDPGANPSSHEIDFYLDNIALSVGPAAVEEWTAFE